MCEHALSRSIAARAVDHPSVFHVISKCFDGAFSSEGFVKRSFALLTFYSNVQGHHVSEMHAADNFTFTLIYVVSGRPPPF